MVFLGLGRETFLSSPNYQVVRSLFRNRQDSLFLLTTQSFSLQIIIYIIIMDTVAKVAKLRDPTKSSRGLCAQGYGEGMRGGKADWREGIRANREGFRNSALILAFTQVYPAFQLQLLQPLAFSKVWQKIKSSLSRKPTEESKTFLMSAPWRVRLRGSRGNVWNRHHSNPRAKQSLVFNRIKNMSQKSAEPGLVWHTLYNPSTQEAEVEGS